MTSTASEGDPAAPVRSGPVGSDGRGVWNDPMWSVRRADGTVTTGWALMPLRLFLGVTFLYAGLQKLANPEFLKASSPTSIHAQLVGAVRSSPIHGLITHLVPVATAVGLVIAIGEVAIGLGILVGLWMRVASVAGMALSLGLFLTISFHSSPYFTGSDIVFLFAWTPIVLAGAGGAVALDTWLARRPAPGVASDGAVSRRAVLSKGALTGATAAVVVIGGGLVALIGRAVGGTTTTSAAGATRLSGSTGASSTTAAPSTGTPPTTAPSTSTTTGAGGAGTTTSEPSPSTTAALPSGTSIGAASGVPVGGSSSFTDPASGDPGLVIQQTAGEFVAFDAVCPHAGCTVAYQRSAKIIACPCHGSEFNARTGAVIQGPATNGLTTIRVIRGSNGDLYVPS